MFRHRAKLRVLLALGSGLTLGAAACSGSQSPSTPAPPLPPSGLTYSTNPAVYTRGVPIGPNVPSSSGGAVASYSVTPALPSGLALDASTGVISGIPSVATATAGYTVTAGNPAGSTTATLTITVEAPPPPPLPPSDLAYSTNPATYRVGVEIAANVPSSTGGPVVSYEVSPALPAGLSLDSFTGAISGIPATAVTTTGYVVTARNAGGSTAVSLIITVEPTTIAGTVTALAAAGSYTCAILDGGVGCWGGNEAGQLGNGSTTDSRVPVPVSGLPAGSGVTAVSTFGAHTCAVVNGAAWCWGSNGAGQLGNATATTCGGTTPCSTVPVPVSGLTGTVTAIAAGLTHTCAVVDSAAWCWGDNEFGKLGNGTVASSGLPAQVTGLTSGVTAVSVGAYHSCAIVDGGVRCWGANHMGELGSGSTANSSAVPVEVSGLPSGSGVADLAAAQLSTCAVANGAARCWGENGAGQLGGTSWDTCSYGTPCSRVPLLVYGLWTDVTEIAAGSYHGCAIQSGAVQCWGNNWWGQLGNTSLASSDVPVPVPGMTGARALSGRSHHSCVVQDGFVWCWGENGRGQLGNGSTAGQSNVPVLVLF